MLIEVTLQLLGYVAGATLHAFLVSLLACKIRSGTLGRLFFGALLSASGTLGRLFFGAASCGIRARRLLSSTASTATATKVYF